MLNEASSAGISILALATIFSARREYPCDHYTAIINVTLMNTGCPRTNIHETALQLLQILDKRFFGSVSPLDSVGADGADCKTTAKAAMGSAAKPTSAAACLVAAHSTT